MMLMPVSSSVVEAVVDPVEDEALVDALVQAAAAVGLPLDEQCVEGTIARSDVANLDDQLARQQLLDQLDEVASEPSSTELIVLASPASVIEYGFLVFAAPSIVDVAELRRQLLNCVAGPADPDLVDQVAAHLLAGGQLDQSFDLQCVERMLTTFSEDTLRLILDYPNGTTIATDVEVTEENQADASRCRSVYSSRQHQRPSPHRAPTCESALLIEAIGPSGEPSWDLIQEQTARTIEWDRRTESWQDAVVARHCSTRDLLAE